MEPERTLDFRLWLPLPSCHCPWASVTRKEGPAEVYSGMTPVGGPSPLRSHPALRPSGRVLWSAERGASRRAVGEWSCGKKHAGRSAPKPLPRVWALECGSAGHPGNPQRVPWSDSRKPPAPWAYRLRGAGTLHPLDAAPREPRPVGLRLFLSILCLWCGVYICMCTYVRWYWMGWDAILYLSTFLGKRYFSYISIK